MFIFSQMLTQFNGNQSHNQTAKIGNKTQYMNLARWNIFSA